MAAADTWQNVATVLFELKTHHIRTVITVTDPFHEDRAMAIASAQGLIPYPSPVRNSPTIKIQLWRYYLKETLEVGVGRIIGYGRLSSWTDHATEASRLVWQVTKGAPGKIAQPFGGGVIGNTTGSGPVIQGSSPCPRANEVTVMLVSFMVPSSSGLGHHPLKVEARVRIPLGLLGSLVRLRS